MQRVAGLAVRTHRVRGRGRLLSFGCQPALHRPWSEVCGRRAHPSNGNLRALRRHPAVFAGHRWFSSDHSPDGTPESSGRQPAISVVGTPDPITWIRCRAIMYLTELYFEVDMTSDEFDRGVKQALVYVSNTMSRGKFTELQGIVSNEMLNYVEKKCRALSDAQRQQLAVSVDDIIFMLPEDISVVFDKYGRKFCSIVMRFWIVSTHEGLEDPEGTKIFKVARSEDGSSQKKIATAVYEFHRELTRGASPDWTVTTVWHWPWKPTE